MVKYRKITELTDEEIVSVMKEIFPETTCVDNIKRDTAGNRMSCDIHIMEEYPDVPDTLELSQPSFNSCGLTTQNFRLTEKETWKWQQWLLAKGCDERLKDNPYLKDSPQLVCNIGTTVFYVDDEESDPVEMAVTEICIADYGTTYNAKEKTGEGTLVFDGSDIGDLVFLTHDAAMREMEERRKKSKSRE